MFKNVAFFVSGCFRICFYLSPFAFPCVLCFSCVFPRVFFAFSLCAFVFCVFLCFPCAWWFVFSCGSTVVAVCFSGLFCVCALRFSVRFPCFCAFLVVFPFFPVFSVVFRGCLCFLCLFVLCVSVRLFFRVVFLRDCVLSGFSAVFRACWIGSHGTGSNYHYY